jgi:predicted amidophosphoribosyltransferase
VPTVEEVTARLLPALIPVPKVGVGVCDVCHGWTESIDGESFPRCTSCTRTLASVAHPAKLVVPITLCQRFDAMHDMLRNYKDSLSAGTRATLLLRVAALIARFTRDHGDCIRKEAGRDWDTMTVVPSSGSRAGTHPIEAAVCLARAHIEVYRPLLRREPDVRIDRRRGDDGAYEARGDVRGLRVLLVDDTFTTGARVHSATSALTLAGADVVACVVVGRFVNPDYHPPESDSYWNRQRNVPFDFETCCVESE